MHNRNEYNTYKNVFQVFQELDNLTVLCKESITSPNSGRSPNAMSSFNEDQFFRSSSIDYFRSSSITENCKRIHSDDFDYFNDNKKKLTSKNVFVPDDFKISSTLGIGAYSKVIKAKHKKTEEVYAVKIIDKKFMEKEKKFYQIYVENEILNLCNHPNIINIFGAYEDEENVYLVLEYCAKGNLQEYINKNGIIIIFNFLIAPLDLDLVKFFLAQIVIIIEYLAQNNIVHRDIKPDNLVIDKNLQLKLVDFSTCTFKGKIFDEDQLNFVDEKLFFITTEENDNKLLKEEKNKLTSGEKFKILKKQHFVGTAEYMSPEVLQMKEIGVYTDLWSLGCIVYQMFMGDSPFLDKTEYLIFQNILNLNFNLDSTLVPEDARNLIGLLLKLNPEKRLGNCLNEDNSLENLKSHNLFNNFNMKKYLDIIERNLKGVTKSTGPFTLATELKKNVSKSAILEEIVEFKEVALKAGVLKKKSPWYFYDKRKIILYNTPRIDYFDPDSNVLKGSVPLTKDCRAELIDHSKFDLKTPNRDYTFLCKNNFDIYPWVLAINEAIENFAKS